ncbi:MAG: TonB-dependent receptor [Phenylobacterium sp.]|uniref:TonB-dependent receptor n=1 Tax=Phenylobacterium sp. TaxID=1871053 RepID=UPI0027336125|nr:TonB-dependent receptor [Phenylobacterium sp.]MDP3747683.1 TonB-dependent receptor [Phenylobacterium sp.]
MHKTFWFMGLSAMALSVAGGASAQAIQTVPAAVPKAPTGAQLEEVIVTASRRNESIRETPTAVSAFGGAALAKAQVADLSDLAPMTPNVQISSLNTTSNVTIRGIGNSQVTAGSDPGVALHFDGVYLAQSGLVTSTFLDINRVEVLRGPQGTLFGRNATGGAINVLPNLPTADLSYGANATLGADPALVRTSAFVSGPLDSADAWRGRLSLQQNYNQGFDKNLAPNGPRRLGDQNTYSGRAQLQWLPNETFTARLEVESQNANDNGSAFYLFGTPDPAQPLPAQLLGAPTGDPDKNTAYANVGARKLSSRFVLVTTDWQVAGGDLKTSYSYNRTRQFTNLEDDGTPVAFASAIFHQHAHQHYAEALYASDASKALTFVVGANYFQEQVFQDIAVAISFLPVPVNLRGDVETKSYAAFGHAQYAFSPAGKVFAGVRYSHDAKSIDDFNNFVGTLSQSKSWAKVTYEAGLTYDLSRAITGYVKYATGYKSGGFSSGSLAPAFNPETDKNMEVGLKGSYFDGKLQANLAAFHTKYDNLQVNQIIGVSSAVTNAAKATIDGGEIELVARISSRLRIEANGAYLDGKFDKFLTQDSSRPALGVIDLAGNRLPDAPRFTGSAGLYYDLPISSGMLTFSGRYDWKARRYFSEFNLPINSQAAAGRLDLAVNYASQDERFTASLFARNVTDKRVRSQEYVISAILGSLAIGQFAPGRQIGASLGYRF